MKNEQSPACCPKGNTSNRSLVKRSLKAFVILLLASIMMLPANNMYAQCTLGATATGTNPTACGQCNGSAIANPSGGTAPYTYLWSTGSTAQSIGQGSVS